MILFSASLHSTLLIPVLLFSFKSSRMSLIFFRILLYSWGQTTGTFTGHIPKSVDRRSANLVLNSNPLHQQRPIFLFSVLMNILQNSGKKSFSDRCSWVWNCTEINRSFWVFTSLVDVVASTASIIRLPGRRLNLPIQIYTALDSRTALLNSVSRSGKCLADTKAVTTIHGIRINMQLSARQYPCR